MNYNELKKLNGVNIVDEKTLRMKFDVDEYIDEARLNSKNEQWIAESTGLVICKENEWIVSTIECDEFGSLVQASYCIAGNGYENTECEDDIDGVVDLWITE